MPNTVKRLRRWASIGVSTGTIVLGLFLAERWYAVAVFGQRNLPSTVSVTLYDAANGRPVEGNLTFTGKKGTKSLAPSGDLAGPSFDINNDGADPIEYLRISRQPYQPIEIKQLKGGVSSTMHLVLWPENGPKTLDRVFANLLTYERIFYDHGMDFSENGRQIWSGIKERYRLSIAGMPNPSIQFQNEDAYRRQMAVEKYEWVKTMFNSEHGVLKPHNGGGGHCPCRSKWCCWCGQRK